MNNLTICQTNKTCLNALTATKKKFAKQKNVDTADNFY